MKHREPFSYPEATSAVDTETSSATSTQADDGSSQDLCILTEEEVRNAIEAAPLLPGDGEADFLSAEEVCQALKALAPAEKAKLAECAKFQALRTKGLLS